MRRSFGHGVGSFPILEGWVKDERRYPHNVILEVLCELGLVGLILFGALLVSAPRCVKLHDPREDPMLRCVFQLAIWALSSAMVSGDFSDNRPLCTMLGLLGLPATQELGAAVVRRQSARLGAEWRRAVAGGIGPRARPEADARCG